MPAPPSSASSARRAAFACLCFALLLAGCASGPDYVRPSFTPPAAYKETGPWTPAQPREADARAPWWAGYGDAELDTLVRQVEAANPSLRVAEAQYREARAAVQLARAEEAPTVGLSASAGRARAQANNGYKTASSHAIGLDAAWEPDLWGRVARSVEAGEAGAQASAADLAAARLSLQAELVQDYLQLRITDAQKDLLSRTVQDDERALALTRSQYRNGVASRADVASAETQLQSVQAQALDLDVQRRQLEHAIAALTGRAPSELSIAPRPGGALGLTLPEVPPGLPSQLLERRPDIAAAERRAAAANAQIGVAQAAYFPSLSFSASGGFAGGGLGPWLAAPGRVWSLGAALAATLFDGGARRARTDQAVAAYDAAAAQYKATVLAGLQEVEDQLAALHVLHEERQVQEGAVASARVAAQASLAQYRAGTTTYLSVLTTQTQQLSNERAAVQLLGRELVASAALVKALGGGWENAAALAPPSASSADASARLPTPTR